MDGNIEISDGMLSAPHPVPHERADVFDCEGDFLLPGLIDIHTDNIEHYAHPRPGVRWPSMLAAVLAHDWQLLGSGITTVLDALSLGDYDSGGNRAAMLNEVIPKMIQARAAGLLKADHYFHFRCELSDPVLPDMVERHLDNPDIKLVSIMDHTPGQRQWHNLELYREFRRKKNARVWNEDEFTAYIVEKQEYQRQHVPNRRATIGELCRSRGIIMASHDDTTAADAEESSAEGIKISEFPTTIEAARRSRELNMKVVMGAPNIVLGGSHSGNVSAIELAHLGLLDVLTSDYVPGSLLQAIFSMASKGFDLSEAVAMVTKNPADLLGFNDRGHISPGLKADLIRVRLIDGVPIIRNIWVAGRQYL
ncbi:alpha-D-ribose 1-methylphosphonate 5-triphosphate diphosphatase [Rhizobium sp. ZPR3]|uniref:Alpha-D-ribose 1-methylphosphonate 5-triphosphate diphosphatase n=2 Tax=unclassified Rhizobium TaxID=2613769 RepID=A0AAU7SQR4_9HYPH